MVTPGAAKETPPLLSTQEDASNTRGPLRGASDFTNDSIAVHTRVAAVRRSSCAGLAINRANNQRSGPSRSRHISSDLAQIGSRSHATLSGPATDSVRALLWAVETASGASTSGFPSARH